LGVWDTQNERVFFVQINDLQHFMIFLQKKVSKTGKKFNALDSGLSSVLQKLLGLFPITAEIPIQLSLFFPFQRSPFCIKPASTTVSELLPFVLTKR
jgi:hypothetical protein